MLDIIKQPRQDSHRHWISIVAIGKEHHAEWLQIAAPGIIRYCEKFGLGLAAFSDHLDTEPGAKHPSWQKLLVGRNFHKVDPDAAGILVLDTDILANGLTGESFFDHWNPTKIGMVSKRFGMPYAYEEVAHRVCFLRNQFVDSKYPLDSIWHFTLDQLYRHEGLEPVKDECCAGLFAFSPELHSEFLASIYDRYRDLDDSLALEQVQVNHHVQTSGHLQVLDYRFHTLWVYEMAVRYPFLYQPVFSENRELVSECIGASLLASTFLHFAGGWNESALLEVGADFLDQGWDGQLKKFTTYRGSNPKAAPRGRILPSSNTNGTGN